MSREVNPNEGVLRHPDGSVDIAAYARLAHRERAAAIAASAGGAMRMVREMILAVRASLVRDARPGPASASLSPCGRGWRLTK